MAESEMEKLTRLERELDSCVHQAQEGSAQHEIKYAILALVTIFEINQIKQERIANKLFKSLDRLTDRIR